MQSYIQPKVGSEALIPELEEYRCQFVAIKDDATALLSAVNTEQFNWRLQPGSWSIAECFDHLNVTGKLYGRTVDEKIHEASSRQWFGRGPFRHGWLGNLLVKLTEPPVKLKVKAPAQFLPQAHKLVDVVAAEFLHLQEQFILRLADANGIDLARIKIPSPVNDLLKLTLGQVFGLIAAHERRHLWQARQVLKHPNFPR
jgi:hypothetical protein